MGKLKNKVAVVLGASSINGLGGVIAKSIMMRVPN